MAGFLRNSLNDEFEYGVFEIIIERLLYCSKIMKNTCVERTYKIGNHEEKIRNHLLEQYLNSHGIQESVRVSDICLRFIAEAQENYSDAEDSYSGRADIKVVTENWFRNDINDYYIIECKRIDGSKDLNEKYVNQGISRFVVKPIKYISQNHRNIMFGFVVNSIEIPQNAVQINAIQAKSLKEFVKTDMSLLRSDSEYCLYSSSYCLENGQLELRHIFFDFVQIIKS